MKLDNKVAIVTASSRGIGLACALKLANEGATVYMAARNENQISEIKQRYPQLKLEYVHFDASDDNSMLSMAETVFNKTKKIDILVNNFGGSDVSQDKTIFDTDINYYCQALMQNIKSVFICSQAVANKMKQTGGGSIINISTIGSITPDIARIAYTSSKAAINSLTENIAVQGGQYKIRCNAILPGMINTDAVKNNLPQQFIDIFLKCTPLERIGEVDDIANAVCFLASNESSYITGQIIAVSGGFGNNVTPIYPFFNSNKTK